jgi:hypothetical protein
VANKNAKGGVRKCPNCGYVLSARRTRLKTKQSYRKGDHEYLVGILAHTRRRLEIFRAAGGEASWFDETDPASVEEIKPATCQGCVEPHLIGWNEGEWHHNVKSHGGKRCDCLACGLFLCRMIHEMFRNRVIAVRQAA